MKRITYISLFLLLFGKFAYAEEYFKPYYALNVGAALSFQPVIIAANNNANVTSTPVYCLGLQRIISKKISFGFDYSFIKLTESTNNPSGPGTIAVISQVHMPQVNFRYHTNISKKIDFYLEPKLVYLYKDMKVNFKFSNGNTNINSTAKIPVDKNNGFNLQFCLGTNFRLNQVMVLNAEGAIGLPYFFKVGMMFNIGDTNNSSDVTKSSTKKSNTDDFVNPKSKNKMYR